MAAQHLSLVVLVCMVFADTVNCDIHGYDDQIWGAFNDSGALDNAPVDAEFFTYKDCKGKEFLCNTAIDKCGAAPTSVHTLCPNHIGVVAALGDSITAAFGARAKSVFTALIEYRGVSWSIGGSGEVSSCATLPNIIKEYNPNLRGYSIDTGDENSEEANMNVAVSGGISQDMPDQARRLVDKLKLDSDINFEEDWKLVTLWIGGNNLCAYCDDGDKHSADTYIASIEEALNILHAELPRTFVNLVQILDVTEIAALSDGTFDFLTVCFWVHAVACNCAKGDSKGSVQEATLRYQEKIEELVASERYNSRDDFTVVVQPFFKEVEIPYKNGEPDISYFAPDCFHFSVKGHREAAVALWNNMMEPVGAKSTNWDPGQAIKCPNPDSPYLYTSVNSQLNFNSQSTNEGGEEEGNGSDNSNLGIILGTSITAFVALIALSALVVGVALVLRRRRRSWGVSSSGQYPTPKTLLITKTSKL